MRAVRLGRELYSQPAWGSIRGAETGPGADAVSDDEILAFARDNIGTGYHATGSCRMSKSPSTGVVDAAGRVHGLKGLRVVCGAIIPQVISGNLSGPIYMLAEKIADEIRRTRE